MGRRNAPGKRKMTNKRILITGGNSGIGLVAARELASEGAEVILACRDSDKTRQALDIISAAGSVEAVNLPVDLASLESVRALATTVGERYDSLQVLINNAGTFPASRQLTQDGFEMQFGVNHLAHFLLTNLLLPKLEAGKPATVITVSSKLHMSGKIDFESFRGEKKYSAQAAYGQSKLANLLFGKELAARLDGTGVTSNVLHPGAVKTEIMRDLPWLIRTLVGAFFISPEVGAKTTVMLADEKVYTEQNGSYYDQTRLAEYSPQADDVNLKARLWDVSAELAGLPKAS